MSGLEIRTFKTRKPSLAFYEKTKGKHFVTIHGSLGGKQKKWFVGGVL